MTKIGQKMKGKVKPQKDFAWKANTEAFYDNIDYRIANLGGIGSSAKNKASTKWHEARTKETKKRVQESKKNRNKGNTKASSASYIQNGSGVGNMAKKGSVGANALKAINQALSQKKNNTNNGKKALNGITYGNSYANDGKASLDSLLSGKNSSSSLDTYKEMANYNNDLNMYMNQVNNEFNAHQAEINRQWQENMSNSAHQREVKDLQAAGLNPVLSAGGNGAVTPSGSSASSSNWSGADTSAISALASLASTEMQTQAQMYNARLGLEGVKYSSDQSYAASIYGSDRSYQGTKYTADIGRKNAQTSADAVRDSALMSYLATVYSSDNSLAGTMYSADQGLKSSKYGSIWTLMDMIQENSPEIKNWLTKQYKKHVKYTGGRNPATM